MRFHQSLNVGYAMRPSAPIMAIAEMAIITLSSAFDFLCLAAGLTCAPGLTCASNSTCAAGLASDSSVTLFMLRPLPQSRLGNDQQHQTSAQDGHGNPSGLLHVGAGVRLVRRGGWRVRVGDFSRLPHRRWWCSRRAPPLRPRSIRGPRRDPSTNASTCWTRSASRFPRARRRAGVSR